MRKSLLVFYDEIFPRAIMTGVGLWGRELQEVAISSSKRIGGIHEFRHVLLVYPQKPLQHSCHLFLRRLALARDGHLDFQRGIFVNGHRMVYGSSYGNSLRASEFKHRLDILAKERGFNGHLVGKVFIYDTRHALEYLSKAQIGVSLLTHVYHAHGHKACLVATHGQHAISHDIGARVNAQDDFLTYNVFHLNLLSPYLSIYGLAATSAPIVVSCP